ncbi:MAG: glycosyltransferase family 9 protein [Chitinivibrionales bacterium]
MKVLCVCPIGIGNYLLFYPACAYLKKIHPDWSLHLLGLRHAIRELAGEEGLWDDIHIFDPTRLKSPIDGFSMIDNLRKKRFNISLNFFPSNKWQYNLLPYLTGCKKRIGFSYHYHPVRNLDFLLNAKIAVDPHLHDVHQNMQLVRQSLDSRSREADISFPTLFSDEMKAWALSHLKQKKRPIIGIHPGSSEEHGMSAKRWEPEKFGTLTHLLCDKIGGKALVFGGPGESDLKEKVKSSSRGYAEIAPLAGIRQTAALIAQCDLFLCNDSGLMHLAACSGVPTIALFGPTDEKRNGPVGNAIVIRHDMAGFPVWTAENVGNRNDTKGVDPSASLRALSAQEAYEKILPHLERLLSS